MTFGGEGGGTQSPLPSLWDQLRAGPPGRTALPVSTMQPLHGVGPSRGALRSAPGSSAPCQGPAPRLLGACSHTLSLPPSTHLTTLSACPAPACPLCRSCACLGGEHVRAEQTQHHSGATAPDHPALGTAGEPRCRSAGSAQQPHLSESLRSRLPPGHRDGSALPLWACEPGAPNPRGHHSVRNK